jgi:outer membrane protein OmpA-like peptidoglycan-associated protein
MPTEHTVLPDESLADIARRYGFHPDTLWNDASNETLRKKRPGPDFITEGDLVAIPDPRQREESCATGRLHVFRRRGARHTPPLIQCICIPGLTFAFDKSFVRPAVAEQMQKLAQGLRDYPEAKLIVWGHTDRVGDDSYNKKLSERRAESTFAFLTDKVDVWERLYNEEDWGTPVVQELLKDLGGEFDPGPIDGIKGPKTTRAIENYQRSRGLQVDGIAGPDTRKQLFTDYMTGKRDVMVDDAQFVEPKFMGCGEYNPFLSPNEAEQQNKSPGNEANRRVVIYLFRSPPPAERIPCRLGDVGPCKEQISLDPDRRKPRAAGPEFGCAFYDGIASRCGCEQREVKHLRIRLLDPFGDPMPSAVYELDFGGDRRHGRADPDAWVSEVLASIPTAALLRWGEAPMGVESAERGNRYLYELEIYPRAAGTDGDADLEHRLRNLGYFSGSIEQRIRRLQTDFRRPEGPTGVLQDVKEILMSSHDTGDVPSIQRGDSWALIAEETSEIEHRGAPRA